MNADTAEGSDDESPPVSAHRTSPDRTVLTEEGNCDGWIASDLVVELAR
ncbi:MAG: hypothetical protein ABEJ43_06770 [Haloferacaceae archaeon]